jgi:2-polyprenyl-3-methyl-5-hydroxy-6-metoxy-1,4-benzoquinol methylase
MAFEKYARYYDLLYQEKNYEQECDFLVQLFKQYSPFPVTSLLEMGCGSGGHAFPLARRGLQVTGFDLSTGMLELARRKKEAVGLNVDLHQASLTDFQFPKTFDTVICMFAVLNYITTNAELENVLNRVRKHIRDDGLFIIDIWNGLAVLRVLPEVRTKIVEQGDIRIIRMVKPELDAARHICRNHYRMLVLERDKLKEEIEETHIIRFLFPQEISYYLEKAGFEVIKMCGFPDPDLAVSENVWNITVAARARR